MTATNSITFLPLDSGIVSNDSGSMIRFVLTNHSDTLLKLYWIDRAGVEQPFGELPPGASHVQETSSSHAWKVVGADGSGFKFYPSERGMITVSGPAAVSFTDFSEQISHTALGDWSTAQGYGLINIAKSLGVPELGAALPMNGQNNNIALNLVGAPAAWAAGITGKGVKVAVIDIGIAAHPEIDKQLIGGYDLLQRDTDPSPTPGPYVDHALGVASIIAASHGAHGGQDTRGVAPDATLLNVRIGDGNNSTQTVAEGIRWAADNGARVISVPLGNGDTRVQQQISDAVHYAFSKNAVVVIAGGNSSNYGATGPALSALSGEAIAVGNQDALAGKPFASSNEPGATPFPWVMAASSGYVPVSGGGYKYFQDGGTSFAGPYVAGLAALLIQQSPDASARDIIASIIRGASIGPGEATASLGEVITGTAGADRLQVAKAARIDGGAGIDTAVFAGESGKYSISASKDGFVVTGKDGVFGSASLSNVERLAFGDTAVALDIAGNGGMVYRLYQAAFGRTPDAGGLGFWIAAKDSGQQLDGIAGQFLGSAEAVKLYGAAPSHAALVDAVYRNVLHRAPDKAGYDYWVAALDSGGSSTAQLLTSFSESGENQAALAGVIGNGFAYTPYG
ncbi:S8 family serine peptidase [Massilia yuzhufengensis]|uniref:Serine protease, subtilisin family n=1 Tax=Massilia yuzhufengensis TaxID=1164594 RepID=A0A1I1LSR7_9BURK|nr:S8 family serine peptidase [Massilia yuzhufengensis]SFC73333.1 Serine protease, subtilisin family [Massilia yuzhufengensis]